MAKYDSAPLPTIDDNFGVTPTSPIDTKYARVAAKADILNDKYQAVPVSGLEEFEGEGHLSATKRAKRAFEAFDKEMLDMQIRQQEAALRGFTDEAAFMSDEFSRTAAGNIINTGGAIITGTGWFTDIIASAPANTLEGAENIVRSSGIDTTGIPGMQATADALETYINKPFIRPFFQALDIGGDVINSFTDKFHNDSETQRTHHELVRSEEHTS